MGAAEGGVSQLRGNVQSRIEYLGTVFIRFFGDLPLIPTAFAFDSLGIPKGFDV